MSTFYILIYVFVAGLVAWSLWRATEEQSPIAVGTRGGGALRTVARVVLIIIVEVMMYLLMFAILLSSSSYLW